jgi:catechol 2,3-dioxygenase-like lactoylglutathione lyase family enzyme
MLQPDQSIIEICHVVTDMDAAIDYWTNVIGAGPFFVGDMELTENQFYRGKPCEQSIQVALGFSGGVVIELVRPIRDLPSAFREVLDTTGPGFHHVMLRVDYDASYKRLSEAGYEVALHCVLPSGERCTLFDTRKDSGGYIELMDISPLVARQLETMAHAHREWDGKTRPVRPLLESFA